MYKIRASYLSNILSNPDNYFQDIPDISNLPQVKKGRVREIISYELFNDFKHDLDLNYKKQVEATKTFGDIELIGHPDILGNDYIVDIKNSKMDDEKLIKEYQYQLATYAYLFDIKNVYLFIDNNTGTKADLSKCRLIKVDISDINMEETLTSLEYSLNILTQKPTIIEDENIFAEYDALLRAIEEFNKKKKELESEFDMLAKKSIIQSKHYILKPAFKKNIKYQTTKTALPWNGEYKESWILEKVEQ